MIFFQNKSFKTIEHTADVGIEAYGKDIKEAYANTALGMFSLITDLKRIKREITYKVEAEGIDQESLLVNWLNNLIYEHETKKMVFNNFYIFNFSDTKLSAAVYGEKIKAHHRIKTIIKAATFNNIVVAKEKNRCKVQVVFDV